MAKGKKSSVDVDVNVKGKGVKKTTLEMKNLGTTTKNVSKSTAEANRNWKGASKQSSGASKNFSKLSQGMGGIVGAYATLAANIFAIGAAFRFLKSAGDLQKMKEGQIIYASSTGIALRSLTMDIIAATDAQVTFSDASQAAAIGKAAGLTNDQLVALGKGAKDVSIILGRDVTDSFNRLVRGVTKAEPELLDELGIILRLEKATTDYGIAINKSADDLTEWERSQAVAVNVMGQLEDKYGRMMAVVEPSGNSFTQLAVAFDNIVNKIKEIAYVIAGPVADVLTKVPLLAIGLLASFANSLIKTGLQSWTTNAALNAAKLKKEYQESKDALEKLQNQSQKGIRTLARKTGPTGLKTTQRLEALSRRTDPETKKLERFKAFARIKAGEIDKLTSREVAAMKRSLKNNKTMSKKIKDVWVKRLGEIMQYTKLAAKGQETALSNAAVKVTFRWQGFKLFFSGVMTHISGAAAAAGAIITKAMSFMMWASLIATLGTTIYQFFKTEEAADDMAKELGVAADKVKALNEEFSKFNELQKIITEDGHGFIQFFGSAGNRIGSLSATMLKALGKHAMAGYAELIDPDMLAVNIAAVEKRIKDVTGAGWFNFALSGDEANEYFDKLKQQLQEIRDTPIDMPILTFVRNTGATSTKRADEVAAAYAQLREGIAEGATRISGSQEIEGEGDTYSAQILYGDRTAQIESINKAMGELAGPVDEFNRSMEALGGSYIAFLETALDPNTRELGKYLGDIAGMGELIEVQFPGANNEVKTFMDTLREMDDGTPRSVADYEILFARLVKEAEAAGRFGAKVLEWQRITSDNASEVQKLLQDTSGRSTEGKMADTLRSELELLTKDLEGLTTGAPAGTKELIELKIEGLEREIELFDHLDTMKTNAQKRNLATQIGEAQAMIGVTKLVGARLKLEFKREKLANKLIDNLDEQYALELKQTQLMRATGQELTTNQKERLEFLKEQERLTEAQNAQLERQLGWATQIYDAGEQAFETGLQKTFSQFLKAEESSLKDAMKSLAKSVWDSIADQWAKQAAEWVMRGLQKPGDKEGTTIYDHMIRASRDGGLILEGHIKAGLASRGAETPPGIPTDDILLGSDAGDLERIALLGGNAGGADGDGVGVGGREIEEIVTKGTDHSGKGGFGHLLSSFETLFDGFFGENADWIGALGTFFGTGDDGFLHGLGDVFKSLGSTLMDILGTTKDGGSGILGIVAGMFGGPAAAVDSKASGGIFKGGFRKYARGGIATSPTLGLIGEGRYNEAVVPLPNGKAIPVDMRSSAQNNNVTVNVSANGQTQTTGQDNEGLGRAIAAAVQEELQNQKRSGGILNRYGTA